MGQQNLFCRMAPLVLETPLNRVVALHCIKKATHCVRNSIFIAKVGKDIGL